LINVLCSFEQSELGHKDILQTLKIGKACGDDGIAHQMSKSTSETICIPLAIIFNFSLQKGIFPSTWKIARVID
jgi:hypothetical protein